MLTFVKSYSLERSISPQARCLGLFYVSVIVF